MKFTEVWHQILVAKNANQIKFIEECAMCTEKCVLVKNIFTNYLNTGLTLRARVEKTAHLEETRWPTDKDNVPREAVSKEGHADRLFAY